MKRSLKNIPLKLFQDYLKYKGLKQIRTKGGHEVWSRADLYRPVILQTHINPIPEFIIKNNLRSIGEDAKDLIEFMENN